MIRWEVQADQIDLDRWAEASVSAAAGNRRERAQVTRWGNWPVLVIAVVVLAVISAPLGLRGMVTVIAPVAVLLGGLIALSRTSVRRLAKQLRSVPAASEAFSFVADVDGTRASSRSGENALAWSRWSRAAIDKELIVLTQDGGAVLVLPVAALDVPNPPEVVVAQINRWIEDAPTSVRDEELQ